MLIGARTAAWGGGLSAKSYVQDGLFLQIDGIENSAYGVHGDRVLDLKGNVGFGYYSYTINDNNFTGYLSTNNNATAHKPIMDAILADDFTLEMVVQVAQTPLFRDGSTYFSVSNNSQARMLTFWGISDHLVACLNYKDNGYSIASNGIDTDVHCFRVSPTTDGKAKLYDKNIFVMDSRTNGYGSYNYVIRVGYNNYFNIYAVRFYTRKLTDSEILKNLSIDKARFGLT